MFLSLVIFVGSLALEFSNDKVKFVLVEGYILEFLMLDSPSP